MHEDLYELHVCESGRWTVAERYTAAQKDEAVNDAKEAIVSASVEAVKVIRETYDPKEGLFVERTIFRQIKPKAPGAEPPAKAAPARPPAKAAAAPAARPQKPTKEPAAASGKDAPKELKSASNVLSGSPPPKEDTGPNIPFGPILLAVGGAAGAGGLLAFSDQIAARFGGTLDASKLEFGSVALLLVAASLSFYLWQGTKSEASPKKPREKASPAESSPAGDNGSRTSASENGSAASMASTFTLPAEQTAAEPDALPVVEPPPLPEKKLETKKEEPRKETEAVGVAKFDLGEEQARLFQMFEDAQSHIAVRKILGDGKFDPRTRFSCHLFLLGAATVAFGTAAVETEKLGRLLERVLAGLGTDAGKAHVFAAKLDEYREDPRHRALMRAGADAMRAYTSKQTDPGLALADALRQSTAAPGTEKQPSNIIAIMFTDMVSSVEVTQRLGDEGAMKLVQAHNLIVGAALKKWRGHEVKHTGDGIMAVFPQVSDGLSAAATIQRELAEHNRLTMSMPIKIRIGVSAGQPIRERDDFFGTVVQLSSRLCAAATEGEVLIAGNMTDYVPPGMFQFVDRRTVFLKGFPDPQAVMTLDWRAGQRADAMSDGAFSS